MFIIFIDKLDHIRSNIGKPDTAWSFSTSFLRISNGKSVHMEADEQDICFYTIRGIFHTMHLTSSQY
jgi:hypothetical protein